MSQWFLRSFKFWLPSSLVKSSRYFIQTWSL